jgi:hydrogenase nickel incorporation protein HypB
MCGTCGCAPRPTGSAVAAARSARTVRVERSLVEANESRSRALGERLRGRGIDVVGLVGGPGSGKTSLLEATLRRLGPRAGEQAVVEGDCATEHDARRVAACGARVVQITTGSLCHLDAHLVEHALEKLPLEGARRLWIENVGNLVCPAAFRCGERRRVALVSVCEGDDKPQKYPALFAGADLLVVSKLDLLPHVEFAVERCLDGARSIRPGLRTLALSARSGEGMQAWLDWLDEG